MIVNISGFIEGSDSFKRYFHKTLDIPQLGQDFIRQYDKDELLLHESIEPVSFEMDFPEEFLKDTLVKV